MATAALHCEVCATTQRRTTARPPLDFGDGSGGPPARLDAAGRAGRSPTPGTGGLRVEMTLEQACPPEYWRAQCAFKDSMIH